MDTRTHFDEIVGEIVDRAEPDPPEPNAASGLAAEIELVRARLRKRVLLQTASDRFIREQTSLLARLLIADVRARALQPDDGFRSRLQAALDGPLAPLLEILRPLPDDPPSG